MTDMHALGVALIDRGLACGRRKEMESAVLSLIQGLGQIDPDKDPRLTLCAFHNLALFLSELGTLVLARAVLQRAKPLYKRVGDRLMQARATWLEGTIDRLAGRPVIARRKLRKAQETFEELDLRIADRVEKELVALKALTDSAAA